MYDKFILKKIIHIPSVASERANLTLNIESDRKNGSVPWKIEVACKTPNFSGYYAVK